MNQTNLVKKILYSRMRILNNFGFYGVLLMQMKYGLDDNCSTAYTDGTKICFNSNFLSELSNDEVDFVLMHEILHVALKHCQRGKNLNTELYNIACDIVINSNILYANNMNLQKISLNGEPVMHLAPNKNEGYKYTAEEVYYLLENEMKKNSQNYYTFNAMFGASSQFDDHNKWIEMSEDEENELDQKLFEAIEISRNSTKTGSIPGNLLRKFNELKNPTLSWEELLNEFLSFEINDYSFAPPDRRYQDDFFLPDFNEIDLSYNTVYCFIDTSGSITDDTLTAVFSEIKSALIQYLGKITFKILFFDAVVYEPVEVSDSLELLKIRPIGGGGTDFINIFKYIEELNEKPHSVIIFTDGYASFPQKDYTQDFPVLWIIDNMEVTPPWGKIARFKRDM